MKTRAGVLWSQDKNWETMELDLDPPKEHEALIHFTASGLCHTDEHMRHGDLGPIRLPIVGGHEGAGIVEEVGSGTTRVKVGDHVVCSFVPACGLCRYCLTGRTNLCDWGALLLGGTLPDGTFRFHSNGTDISSTFMLGTFSEYAVVHQNSIAKVDDDVNLETAALVGCGVPTGWGSAVYVAKVEPGETVVIYGTGGVGMNAVQGARYAGAKNIVAVDPLAYKREVAETFGATHTCATVAEAHEVVTQLTRGEMAEKAIITVDVVPEDVVNGAVDVVGKDGVVVLTGVAGPEKKYVNMTGFWLTVFQKTIKGALFGGCNPLYDIPRLLDLHRAGQLKLDELVTRRYTVEQIAMAYQDLAEGKNIRGLVVY
ncbi:MAG: NDMA-dependent alcohol dehydrogenase [Acidimicrobiia bacterium]